MRPEWPCSCPVRTISTRIAQPEPAFQAAVDIQELFVVRHLESEPPNVMDQSGYESIRWIRHLRLWPPVAQRWRPHRQNAPHNSRNRDRSEQRACGRGNDHAFGGIPSRCRLQLRPLNTRASIGRTASDHDATEKGRRQNQIALCNLFNLSEAGVFVAQQSQRPEYHRGTNA